jgi:hypothetical protein
MSSDFDEALRKIDRCNSHWQYFLQEMLRKRFGIDETGVKINFGKQSLEFLGDISSTDIIQLSEGELDWRNKFVVYLELPLRMSIDFQDPNEKARTALQKTVREMAAIATFRSLAEYYKGIVISYEARKLGLPSVHPGINLDIEFKHRYVVDLIRHPAVSHAMKDNLFLADIEKHLKRTIS